VADSVRTSTIGEADRAGHYSMASDVDPDCRYGRGSYFVADADCFHSSSTVGRYSSVRHSECGGGTDCCRNPTSIAVGHSFPDLDPVRNYGDTAGRQALCYGGSASTSPSSAPAFHPHSWVPSAHCGNTPSSAFPPAHSFRSDPDPVPVPDLHGFHSLHSLHSDGYYDCYPLH